MPSSSRTGRSGGFTLIELLVVMAILSSLAALGLVGIPRVLRQRDKTVCMERLGQLHQTLMLYQDKEGSLPTDSGPEFVLGPWKKNIVDKTLKDAEIFFCPSMTGKPVNDNWDESVTADTIDFTGPDFSTYQKKTLRTQDRNAQDHVIIANRVPIYESEADLDDFPHAGKGICFLTLGGSKEFIDTEAFGGDYVIIGPDSPIEKFQKLANVGLPSR